MKTLKHNYFNGIGFLFLIGVIFMLYLVYSNLDKGFIFNDEAFYLFFYRDHQSLPTVDATNFYRIFNVFFSENLYVFRIITYGLLNLSTFALYFFAGKYYQLKLNAILIGFIGIGFNFITWGISNIVLHQYIGNTILVNFSLSFIFIYLLYRKLFPLLISGFLLGLVLFNGIPHTIVIIPISLFLLFNFWKSSKKTILYIVIGGILGIIFYFSFIESLSQFISQFEWIKFYQQFHTKQHPKSFFFYWILKVVGFILLPSGILIGYIHQFSKNKIKILDFLIIIFAIIYIISLFFYSTIYINYIFLSLFIYRYFLSDMNIEKKTFLVLLALIPFALSFGSGAYFESRGEAYNIYFYLVLIVILASIYSLRYFIVFVAFFLHQCFIFPNQLYNKGWKDFVFTEQTEKVTIKGNDLYLDKARKKDIEDLRPYLQNQPHVIYSNNHLLGYLYLLEAKPPIYYYFTLKKYLEFVIEKVGKTPDDFIYFESDNHPFSAKEFLPLNFVSNPEKYKVVKAGRFTLYLPANYQKK